MENLWGFTKNNLKKDIGNSPHGILKDQMEYFEKNTNDVLLARIKNFRILDKECQYPLATSFEIVAPALDSYAYKLFTMYCKPESDFPVLVFTREAEDILSILEFNADFLCKDEQEFISALRELLGSEDTTRIVQTLYSKCNL